MIKNKFIENKVLHDKVLDLFEEMYGHQKSGVENLENCDSLYKKILFDNQFDPIAIKESSKYDLLTKHLNEIEVITGITKSLGQVTGNILLPKKKVLYLRNWILPSSIEIQRYSIFFLPIDIENSELKITSSDKEIEECIRKYGIIIPASNLFEIRIDEEVFDFKYIKIENKAYKYQALEQINQGFWTNEFDVDFLIKSVEELKEYWS